MEEKATYEGLIGVMIEYIFSTLSDNDIVLHPSLYDIDDSANRIGCKIGICGLISTLWYDKTYGDVYVSSGDSLLDKPIHTYSIQYQKVIYNVFYEQIVKPLCCKRV